MSPDIAQLIVTLLTGILLVGALLALAANKKSLAWLLLVAGSPWAMERIESDFLTLTLPNDVFAGVGSIGVGLFLLFYPQTLEKLMMNPVLKWVMIYLAWMGLTTPFSEHPVISLKFWISQTAYFLTFGVGGYLWASGEFSKQGEVYLRVLLISAVVVLGYCVFRHLELGGTKHTVDKAIIPFMREHTVYGAYSAWFSVSAIVSFFLWRRWWIGLGALVSLSALFLSYSRGAWLSAIGALGLWVFIEGVRRIALPVRIGLGLLAIVGIAALTIYFMSYNPQLLQLQARWRLGEAGEHLISSFDLQRNLSNMERLNRWDAALQMIRTRPLLGFGPNTFSREYSAYQSSLTRTAISVEMGEMGGAHSEYLTAAAEMGIPGLVLLLLIYFSSLKTGLWGMWYPTSSTQRWTFALFTLPLLSYYLHGVINNFMDHGHMAAFLYLHWGIIGALAREVIPSFYVSAH
ncbi:MAG: O-antigen ligase family protein [Bacteroidia bacterium]|nr:O-antigen ligase family protein [Bacteroidia bacterium]MDW8015350.1 O-antigen ligase family protein [Bacteroidia bacterium]